MKILLSPAKKLDFDKTIGFHDFNVPIFTEKTTQLQQTLKKISAQKIGELMKLSPQLSQLNYDRYQAMGDQKNPKTPAGFAFNGEVYTGLDIENLTPDELKQADEKIRILSGLYGVLKPSTLIEPYRLEMGTKLEVEQTKNLYQFWADDIINALNTEEKELIINLASNEYNKAAQLKKFTGRVITPNFKEFKNGEFKTIMMYAKKARGTLANWIIKQNIESADEIKNFNEDGYLFNENLSEGDNWLFTR